ncbi:hypothetical protein PR048_009699 [Dryococelus australis]|uniref:Uncharacterized protein n=1 Tax=Dryococelus australis TaxID=614101 RepID=A0ABQ9I0L9_9NEOP|nr:hypothetical protein PR048_009699 [Dryococelus australis]
MRMAKIALEKFKVGEEDWNSYNECLEQYFIANDIGEGDNGLKKRKAILVLFIGKVTYELFCYLCQPVKPADKSYSELISILQTYFSPASCVIAARHKFCQESEILFDKAVKIALSYQKVAENMATVSRDCEHNIPDPNTEVHKILSSCVQDSHNHHSKKHISRSFESAIVSNQAVTNSAAYSTNKNVKDKNAACFCYGKPNHFASKCRFRGYKCHICNKLGHLHVMCHLHNRQGNVMRQIYVGGDFQVDDQDNHPEQNI